MIRGVGGSIMETLLVCLERIGTKNIATKDFCFLLHTNNIDAYWFLLVAGFCRLQIMKVFKCS